MVSSDLFSSCSVLFRSVFVCSGLWFDFYSLPVSLLVSSDYSNTHPHFINLSIRSSTLHTPHHWGVMSVYTILYYTILYYTILYRIVYSIKQFVAWSMNGLWMCYEDLKLLEIVCIILFEGSWNDGVRGGRVEWKKVGEDMKTMRVWMVQCTLDLHEWNGTLELWIIWSGMRRYD